MREIVLDSESNGLVLEADTIWIVCTKDRQSQERRSFLPGDDSWMDYLYGPYKLICHNLVMFDLQLFFKLKGWEPHPDAVFEDTLIMSRKLNYRRFGDEGHSMEVWGRHLGQLKQEHEDWSQFSPEMQTRCESDVELNDRMYDILKGERDLIASFNPKILVDLEAEHYAAMWQGRAHTLGWPFKKAEATDLFVQIKDELYDIRGKLEGKLGTKCVCLDKKEEFKVPKWTKAGTYHANTWKYFEVDPWSGFEGEERMIEGPYCRIGFEPLSLSSVADVKTFLYRHGWEPTEWNRKRDEETNKWVNTSPKITEDSLEFLGADGKLYDEFVKSSARFNVLKTWLTNCSEQDRVHGDCFTIGTPSMRVRHQVIANIPSAEAKWGPEIRSLFVVPKGWKFIGADSAGNQLRGLAHYLNDESFTETILRGDVHQANANYATAALAQMGITHTVPRSVAKRLIYAFLFGASGTKLWGYIFGTTDAAKGKEFKRLFSAAIPGLEALMDYINNVFGATKKRGKGLQQGYIYSVSGAKIYVDSFHKLLVYLLQSMEKATCSCAIMLIMKQLKVEGIPYLPLIFYHDEADFAVPEEYAERAAEIAIEGFREGPKLLGVNIMDGGVKIGNDWLECH